jgi:hypothetical protein
MNSAKDKPDKKCYHPPQVADYGNIKEITHGGATSTMSDSGSNQMSPN